MPMVRNPKLYSETTDSLFAVAPTSRRQYIDKKLFKYPEEIFCLRAVESRPAVTDA